MRAILSSNVPHYHYAARALASKDWLERYICGIVPRFGPLERLLPAYHRSKLAGRELPPLLRGRVKSLVVPELAQRATAGSHIVSREQSLRLQNDLFDWLASARVRECDAFHFVASIGLVSARKAKRLGATVICDERAEHPAVQRRVLAEEYASLGLPFEPHVAIWEKRVQREYELSDHLIVGSEYSKETYVDAGWDADRVWVVPYGFEPEIFTASDEREDHDELRILFCGQLTPRKGVHRLVDAFERAGLSTARLRLVGPVDPLLADRVERWRALPGVDVVGEVPKLGLPVHYGWASVLALPSLADAQPLVCLEAMACGLPAIVTTGMGSREIVRDGIDGYVVAPGDTDAITEKLQLLAADHELLASMSRSAGERAREFTWDAYEARLVAAYEQIFQ